MIKNIVFDMGNVLLAYTPHDYIKTITEDEEIGNAVLKELFFSEEWQQLDAGSITEENAVKQVSTRIPQYTDYVQKAMDNWHSDLTPMQGMPELVKRLKEKNYNIYLLSNTSLRFFKYKDKVEMFDSFDGFIVSAQERMVKPNREIFDCLCSRFELNPNECMFVDDLQANIDGAKNAGLNGHLFLGAEELANFFEEQGIL